MSRDKWNGNTEKPLSFNKWLYVYANPILNTDPTGNIPRLPHDPPFTNPWRAHEIQKNIYEIGHPETFTGTGEFKTWEDFIRKYRTLWKNSGEMTWWNRELCLPETDYDRIEIIMGIMMSKEFSGIVHKEDARKVWSEAVGRRFWDHCQYGMCNVSYDWTATNSFLNFLSYDETMVNLTVADISVTFMLPDITSTVLEVADQIHDQGLGVGGGLPDRPYHYFCTNCSAGTSPLWLQEFIKGFTTKDRQGMKSYSADGVMQLAYAAGEGGRYVVLLTPQQKTDLCGQNTCFDPNLQKPEWLGKP